MRKYTTKSFKQTQKLGEGFAKEISHQSLTESAVVLCLQGELGAGKTTFLQGFAKGLGIREKILSPTFIIMKRFKIQSSKPQINSKFKIQNSKFSHFYHFDLYRLNSPKEILHLGFKEIISNPKNIVAIEWPEKIFKILPKNITSIKFKHLKESERELTINK